jgi:ankyrin repeat protein
MEAALNGQREMVDLLIGYGADRTMRDEQALTAADHARRNGHDRLAYQLG